MTSSLKPVEEGRRLPRSPAKVGTLRSNDADGNDNVKKTIGFISKITTLQAHYTCLYISFPVFVRLRRENAYFRVLWRT